MAGCATGRRGAWVALIGDAEMDEGNIYEALVEGWKQGLRNCWWIVDYNRQSLDAVVREGLWRKFQKVFSDFGWNVVIVKHGRLQEAAYDEPGGERLKAWIDACPNQLYSALTYQGGAAWRERLMNEIGDQGVVTELLDWRSDEELAVLMGNLGGHDIDVLLEAFAEAETGEEPTLFVCYTVKGHGLPLAGHKDNHACLLTPAQMENFRRAMGVRPGLEREPWGGSGLAAERLNRLVAETPFFKTGSRRFVGERIAVTDRLAFPDPGDRPVSTQTGFGQILNGIARSDSDFSRRVVTTAPDVAVSTNLGAWVNRVGLFARERRADTFKAERIPSRFTWSFSPEGQHIELGIAEANLFLILSALGLSHAINVEQLLPVGTVYDPFIYRGADQLNYACYQDARLM